jgi:adenylate cyclase
MALLRVTDASRRTWDFQLPAQTICTIGRAPENHVVLDDPRASRHHAHVRPDADGMVLVDGVFAGGQLRRSANGVFVNGQAQLEHKLKNGDQISIGSSSMLFEQTVEERPEELKFDDKPLGHTQMLISASEVMSTVLRSHSSSSQSLVRNKEMEELRRKAEILAVLYEMSRTLGSEFDLKAIFAKATDIIFRVTPADRVVALLSDGFEADGEVKLTPIATKARDEKLEEHAKKLTIGRTITRKVMKDGVALLSQDAASEFTGVDSIVSQGVRSTICAPLMAESRVHGALYADRLDLFQTFSPDDLELISAVAAQTAIAVENVRAHERLAKEEVARANYSRFLPEYVVTQMLENPDSFKLGGVNQTITVLFADIRGFTSLSQLSAPEKVVQLLNKYFSEMTDIIFAHGGTLDKYIGDGLMALFGAPTATPDDAANAMHAAVAMQRNLHKINEELRAENLNEIGIGIGLHTGVATVGYIGSERRSEYTAIGDTVNLASRLESNCKRGQILMSDVAAAAANCRDYEMIECEPIMVKGRDTPVSLFEIKWE